MVVRMLVTAALLMLAAGAFFGAAPVPASPLNPFGILFLAIAGVVWFAWDVIREGFSYGAGSGQDGAQVPLLARFGPIFIKGITNTWRTTYPRRRSSETKSVSESPSPRPSPRERGEGADSFSPQQRGEG
jgi:hypothetical protein